MSIGCATFAANKTRVGIGLMIDEAQDGARPQPGMPLELATRDTLVRRALYAMQHTIDAPLTIG